MTNEQIFPDTAFFFGACLKQPMQALEQRARVSWPEIFVFKRITEGDAWDRLRDQNGKVVEVWGADAYACVGTAIWILIVEGGVDQVLLDLSHIREYETDLDSDTEVEMYARALAILENLLVVDQDKSLNDFQLAMIRVAQSQEEIWEKAVKERIEIVRSRRNSGRKSSLFRWLFE